MPTHDIIDVRISTPFEDMLKGKNKKQKQKQKKKKKNKAFTKDGFSIQLHDGGDPGPGEVAVDRCGGRLSHWQGDRSRASGRRSSTGSHRMLDVSELSWRMWSRSSSPCGAPRCSAFNHSKRLQRGGLYGVSWEAASQEERK